MIKPSEILGFRRREASRVSKWIGWSPPPAGWGLQWACASSNLIVGVKSLLDSEREVQLYQIYREGNISADWMAHFGRSLHFGSHSFDDPPQGLSGLLLHDVAGVSYPRKCLM
ncbi:hypothetical protein GH714_029860 [Hevea brasiliensis]|uniref:Uncharacterized protein n=1 Tax=Hevea brasiliensis TaxID=3981 RepID=A0A6A6LQF2_HEVBR|nr:hypothetical protein GH714_029860 [Hevea brasiliensis]